MRKALILNNEIINIIVADDTYVPPAGTTIMDYDQALQLYPPYQPAYEPPDAKMWQVRVWLARNNINPETVPSLIVDATVDGPERWEALARWNSVTEVPYKHPMVDMIWSVIQSKIERQISLQDAWNEIVSI